VDQVLEQFSQNGCWNMEQLENGLREALLKDGCQILQTLLNQPGALGTYVPVGKVHDVRTRRVQSLLGPFELTRGYYEQGAKRWFPMDELLGLTDSYTPGLLRLMCHAAATDGSYREAEESLRIYAGVQTPSSQIRQIVQQVAPDLACWREKQDTQRVDGRIGTMYVSADGTGVPMRPQETCGRCGKQPDGSARTREVKVGSIFRSLGCDENGYPLREPSSTSYIASFESAQDFGLQLRTEALQRGVALAERQVFIGDGALWVWNLASMNFPDAIQILDFYHACEYLQKLAKALFPKDEELANQAFGRWRTTMRQGKIRLVIEEARQKMPHHGPRRQAVEKVLAYFKRNRKRMRYHTFRKQGLFIGSGVVEAACKTVVGKRAKQSGMFWTVDGAQCVLDIRCSVLDGTFDDYWHYRNQQRRPAA